MAIKVPKNYLKIGVSVYRSRSGYFSVLQGNSITFDIGNHKY